jgi:hypothetical protein
MTQKVKNPHYQTMGTRDHKHLLVKLCLFQKQKCLLKYLSHVCVIKTLFLCHIINEASQDKHACTNIDTNGTTKGDKTHNGL